MKLIIRKCDLCQKTKEKDELANGLVLEMKDEPKDLVIPELCNGCAKQIKSLLDELSK